MNEVFGTEGGSAQFFQSLIEVLHGLYYGPVLTSGYNSSNEPNKITLCWIKSKQVLFIKTFSIPNSESISKYYQYCVVYSLPVLRIGSPLLLPFYTFFKEI